MKKELTDIEKFQAILPIIFALASSNWSIDRKEIGDEEWTDLLASNGLNQSEFQKYENWWFSPKGEAVIKKLRTKFIDSIINVSVSKVQKPLKEYLKDANWPDFIRELSDCAPGQSSYFIEYAVEQALCWRTSFENLESVGIDQSVFNELLEYWFDESSEEIDSIFLSIYPDLAKIK